MSDQEFKAKIDGDSRTNPFKQGGNDRGAWQDRDRALKQDKGIEMETQTQVWKSNIPKDPLQSIGSPMTRTRTKAIKEALNCLIRELKELESIYLEEASFNMSNKSPKMVIIFLKAQQDDV